jgi:hypothetical protein
VSKRLSCVLTLLLVGIILSTTPVVHALSLGSSIRLSYNEYASASPSVAVSGNYVYVAWEDWTSVPGSGTAGAPEIWMRASLNYGASFGSAIRITTNTGQSGGSSVAASLNYVWVSWQDDTEVPGYGGTYEVWIRRGS